MLSLKRSGHFICTFKPAHCCYVKFQVRKRKLSVWVYYYVYKLIVLVNLSKKTVIVWIYIKFYKFIYWKLIAISLYQRKISLNLKRARQFIYTLKPVPAKPLPAFLAQLVASEHNEEWYCYVKLWVGKRKDYLWQFNYVYVLISLVFIQ